MTAKIQKIRKSGFGPMSVSEERQARRQTFPRLATLRCLREVVLSSLELGCSSSASVLRMIPDGSVQNFRPPSSDQKRRDGGSVRKVLP